MIAVLLLVPIAAVALLGLDRGSRRRRALRVVGRLATPGTLALPPAPGPRQQCGHSMTTPCLCGDRTAVRWNGRPPPCDCHRPNGLRCPAHGNKPGPTLLELEARRAPRMQSMTDSIPLGLRVRLPMPPPPDSRKG